MAIKRYFANKDNTVTNAFKENLITRATGSNMGVSDILETFVIHGQTSASISAENAEQSRILIQFPVSEISADMSDGTLPSSTGSIKFHLNLYNAPHGNTLPEDFSLDVYMVSQSWSEGTGLDMDGYSDFGFSNWLTASSGVAWEREGGSFISGSNTSGSFTFTTGLEDLSLDISEQVYKWLDTTDNYGFLLEMTSSIVSGSESYYTKRFFSRSSEFFFYRPTIEARWDSARKDNRGSFYLSSSLATAADNLNTLYLYNVVRGQLSNIPSNNNNKIYVSIFSGSTEPTGSELAIVDSNGNSVSALTASLLVENGANITGVYTASFASTSSYSALFDVWHTGSGATRVNYFTGSFAPLDLVGSELLYDTQYITNLENLQSSYRKGQNPRVRLFTRNKDWSPNIYNVATKDIVPEIIEDAYYRLYREIDNLEIIPYGTASSENNFTRLSYDVSGNYFELDTSLLEPGYSYGIKFAYYLQGDYREQPEVFKFRIEEEDV